MLFAISDTVWSSLITVGGGIVLFYLETNRRVSIEAARSLRHAAVEVTEVKQTLATNTSGVIDRLDEIAKTGEATHKLVNSAMQEQLRLHAETARNLARSVPSAANEEAANKAAQLLAEHKKKQASVDADEEIEGL